MKPWLTVAEAAALTGRSKRTINRWANEGRLRTAHRSDPRHPERYVNTQDVLETQATTDEYRQNPTRGQQSRKTAM